MNSIYVETEVCLDGVALSVARDERGASVAMDFIILIDCMVADYEFTESLIKRLQLSLDKEDAAANGTD